MRSSARLDDELARLGSADGQAATAHFDLEHTADVEAAHELQKSSGQQSKFHEPAAEGSLASNGNKSGAGAG